MKRIVLAAAVLFISPLGAQAQAWRSPYAWGGGYGSYYQSPYGGGAVRMTPSRGGMQSLPGGGFTYSGAYHPIYQGYHGRYSPSPSLSTQRKK